MIGRMSSQQVVNDFLGNLRANERATARVQRELATGKRINTPSDDPVGIAMSLSLRRDMGAVAAWNRNIDDSLTWLGTTDRALEQALEVVSRARELAVQGGNGTLSDAARALIAEEVDSLTAQIGEIGNSSLGGRYIFGGTDTGTPPFAAGALVTPVNTERIRREVGQGAVVEINVTADRLIGPGGATPDVMATFSGLSAALRSGDAAALGTALSQLAAHGDHVSALRGEGAATINRLELTKNRFEQQGIAVTDQLAQIEGVDMAAAITELKMRENTMQATLAVGARIIPSSLLDFLR